VWDLLASSYWIYSLEIYFLVIIIKHEAHSE
jgi:hypothetical protein